MKMSYWIAPLVTMLFLLVSSSALAAVPQTMTYHGNLSTAGGEPVNDVVEATFRIYDGESGGNEVWSEQMASIDVVSGSFSASLGTTQSLEGVFDGNNYWLEINIDGETLSPRTPVESVPYAMRAGSANDAQTIQGIHPDDLVVSSNASEIEFENSETNLAATDLQAALTELSQQVSQLQAALADKVDQSDLNALQSAIADDKADRADLEALQSTVATNTANLSSNASAIAENSSDITALENLTQDIERTTINGYTSLVFEEVNLHLRNGLGSTDGSDDTGDFSTSSVNGLGNLIVGYDEARLVASDKSGSHNLVIGPYHNYSSAGGLVLGFRSSVSGIYSSVSGGVFNVASGIASSVSGGSGNTTSGNYSSVSGGLTNAASGTLSSVSGGWDNVASANSSSVSGGRENVASGIASSVNGGRDNMASGISSSISGGSSNEASGSNSSVSGGYERTTINTYNWRAGTLSESQ